MEAGITDRVWRIEEFNNYKKNTRPGFQQIALLTSSGRGESNYYIKAE